MKESSDLVDLTEDAEDERVKEGRGLLFVGCEVKYDAGLKDRLAMAVGYIQRPGFRILRNCGSRIERAARLR